MALVWPVAGNVGNLISWPNIVTGIVVTLFCAMVLAIVKYARSKSPITDESNERLRLLVADTELVYKHAVEQRDRADKRCAELEAELLKVKAECAAKIADHDTQTSQAQLATAQFGIRNAQLATENSHLRHAFVQETGKQPPTMSLGPP